MSRRAADLRGIVLAVTGFTFWVFADTSIKIVGASRLPAYEIIAFLGIFVSAAVALYAVTRGDVGRLRPRNAAHQAMRSSLDLVNDLCVVIALRHIPLPLFYILVFMAPLLVAILAGIFLNERIGMRKAAAVLAGFAGVVIAVNPFGASRQGDWVGYGACLVCVACFSVNMVWSRVLTRTESAESLAFFSGLVMAVTGFAAMLWRAEPIPFHWFAALMAMGLFCAIGSISFFVALKHTAASTVSQYHYTQLLTGSLVTYLVWGQLPTVGMMAGGALIVAAGLYVAVDAAYPTPSGERL